MRLLPHVNLTLFTVLVVPRYLCLGRDVCRYAPDRLELREARAGRRRTHRALRGRDVDPYCELLGMHALVHVELARSCVVPGSARLISAYLPSII